MLESTLMAKENCSRMVKKLEEHHIENNGSVYGYDEEIISEEIGTALYYFDDNKNNMNDCLYIYKDEMGSFFAEKCSNYYKKFFIHKTLGTKYRANTIQYCKFSDELKKHIEFLENLSTKIGKYDILPITMDIHSKDYKNFSLITPCEIYTSNRVIINIETLEEISYITDKTTELIEKMGLETNLLDNPYKFKISSDGIPTLQKD